ncbi:MAG: PAS domain S-box protein [Bacteroidia bacterium]
MLILLSVIQLLLTPLLPVADTASNFSIALSQLNVQWWYVLPILIGSATLLFFILKKVTQDTSALRNVNTEDAINLIETRQYFLILAFLFPILEFFIDTFHLKSKSELILSVILGSAALSIYFISGTNKAFQKNIRTIFMTFFLFYASFFTFQCIYFPFELTTYSQFLIAIFFSYSIFNSSKHFYIFISIIFLTFFGLLFTQIMPLQLNLVYLYSLVAMFNLNFVWRLGVVNSRQKLLFANNIVHNGNSLIIATNKWGHVSFCSDNVISFLGYTPQEVMGEGFFNLTQDGDFEAIDYNKKYVEGKIYTRKLKTKNGSFKYIQWIDKKQGDDVFVGIGQDVTEQINVQEQYKNIVQNASDIIYESNALGIFTFVNDVVTRSLGYTPQELIGKHFTHLVHADYKFKVGSFYANVSANTNYFDIIEFPVVGKKNTAHWVSQKVNVKRNDAGEIVGYSAIVRDITSLKNNELINTKRQEKTLNYNAIINSLTTKPNASNETFDSILSNILTVTAQSLKTNRVSVWKYNENTLVCAKVLLSNTNTFDEGEILKDTDFPTYFNALAQGKTIIAHNVCDNEYTKEFCAYDDNDIKSLLDIPLFTNGELMGLICCEKTEEYTTWDTEDVNFVRTIADIISITTETEKRLKAEAKIKESESNFRLLNETIDDVFWLHNLQTNKIIYISASCERVLGVNATAFYETNNYWKNYILDEDKPAILLAHKKIELEGFYEIEYRIKINNEVKWIFEKSFGIKNELGEYIKSSGICTDITQKKKTELELKQLSIVAQKTNNGVLITNNIGQVIWANEGYLAMFEISLDNLVGKRPRDLFNANDEQFSTEIDEVSKTGFTKEIETYTYLKNKKWVEINNTVVLDDAGNVEQQIEVLTDITDKVNDRNVLAQNARELEFQSSFQKKLINSLSFNDITTDALGFIKNQTKGCNRIALYSLDERNTTFTGYTLINEIFVKTRLIATETSSYSRVAKGEIFIQKNLATTPNKSVSDIEELNYGVLSYVVLPILSNNKLIGLLNVSFDHEFDLSNAELQSLNSFTALLSVAMQQVELKNELIEKNKDTIDSLNYAQNIQSAILPNLKNMNTIFNDVCVYFKPRDIVSGDFYWAKEINGFTFIAVADCTGHGVPGAFLTLIGSLVLEQIIVIEKTTNPAEILSKLDERIYLSLNNKHGDDIMRDGMEIALCVIDKQNRKLEFAGAGLGLLYFDNEEEFYIKGQRKSIGDYRSDIFNFETTTITFTGNEVFYMSTDGYQDQLGGANYKRFSKKRTIELFRTIAPENGLNKENNLHQEIVTHIAHHQQTDDITVVAFKLNTSIQRVDFSSAKQKHLNWKNVIADFLQDKGTLTEAQAVSHLHCDLGKWYYTEGKIKYGHIAVMQEFEAEHITLHQLIKDILVCKKNNDVAKCNELYLRVLATSDQIVALLTQAETIINI